MAHLGYDRNHYGTLVSLHKCDVCGQRFTLCPGQDTDEPCGYPPSHDPDNQVGCQSYDPDRDVVKLLSDGWTIRTEKTERGSA